MRCRPGSVRSSIIESECSSAFRPACPLVEWSVPSRRMFVGESRIRPFCFVRAAVVPAGRRLFASETPLFTERYPAAPQMTSNRRGDHDEHRPPSPGPPLPRLHRTTSLRRGVPVARRRVPTAAPCPSVDRLCRRGTACPQGQPSGGLRYPLIVSTTHAIGVDLGGTKILAGVVTREGEVVRRHERA